MSTTTSNRKSSSRKRTKRAKTTFDWEWAGYVVLGLITIVLTVKAYSVAQQTHRISEPAGVQAVFLTNGQVYFGTLHRASGDFFRLTNAHYLQEGTTATDIAGSETEAQFSLIKVGSEIHQPQNELTIRAEHILFWEPLTSGSPILAAMATDQ